MHKNKNYVVIGANGGIGSCLVRQLVADGARVQLLGRNGAELEQLAVQTGMSHHVVDACDFKQVEQAIAEFHQQVSPIHGVVNCVGSIVLKPAHLMSQDDFMGAINTNLTSAMAAVRASTKVMTKTGGSIVLLSTAASLLGLANHEAIAAAKGGINGLTLAAAATYAANKIRVNAVAPGLVDTPLSAKIINNPKALELSLKGHPLGRIGQPEDIARMIAFLLDEYNSWITGQIIAVDGGLGSLKKLG